MPETSVIIPTYNRLPFLREAVESVLKQTYQDFELIVVDDGSTDSTAIYARENAAHLKYIFQKNQGPSAARNRGIKAAQGEFITFLDSDDLWQKNKLDVQLQFMKARTNCRVSYTNEIWIRRGVRVNPKKKHSKHSGCIFEHCLPLCIVSPSSVMMRREFFDEVGFFDEALPACEDYDLWLRASLHMPFHFIDKNLIIKRGGHSDQLSTAWGLDRYRVQALLKLLDKPELTPEKKQKVKAYIISKSQILAQGFNKRGKKKETAYYQCVLKEQLAN